MKKIRLIFMFFIMMMLMACTGKEPIEEDDDEKGTKEQDDIGIVLITLLQIFGKVLLFRNRFPRDGHRFDPVRRFFANIPVWRFL